MLLLKLDKKPQVGDVLECNDGAFGITCRSNEDGYMFSTSGHFKEDFIKSGTVYSKVASVVVDGSPLTFDIENNIEFKIK